MLQISSVTPSFVCRRPLWYGAFLIIHSVCLAFQSFSLFLSCRFCAAPQTNTTQLSTSDNDLIGYVELQTSSNAVYLMLHPVSDDVGDVGIALRGLVDFVERWEFVDLDFEVRELDFVGVVGSRLLILYLGSWV